MLPVIRSTRSMSGLLSHQTRKYVNDVMNMIDRLNTGRNVTQKVNGIRPQLFPLNSRRRKKMYFPIHPGVRLLVLRNPACYTILNRALIKRSENVKTAQVSGHFGKIRSAESPLQL